MYCQFQVNSLRAQANEHRLVKEKLQAAVAAALAGEVAVGEQSPGNHAASGSDGFEACQQLAASASNGIMADLQDAVSSLQASKSVRKLMGRKL